MRIASGHRAEDWNLATPLLTGYLRLYQADLKLRICLYSYKDPTTMVATDENLIQFGECPIDIEANGDMTKFVDGVIDSSRYYVLRLKDPKSARTTSIGVGFREKDTAFDFKSALNDYIRYVNRMALAGTMADQEVDKVGDDEKEGDEARLRGASPAPKLDLAIRPGEKIKIKISRNRKGGGDLTGEDDGDTDGDASRDGPGAEEGSHNAAAKTTVTSIGGGAGAGSAALVGGQAGGQKTKFSLPPPPSSFAPAFVAPAQPCATAVAVGSGASSTGVEGGGGDEDWGDFEEAES